METTDDHAEETKESSETHVESVERTEITTEVRHEEGEGHHDDSVVSTEVTTTKTTHSEVTDTGKVDEGKNETVEGHHDDATAAVTMTMTTLPADMDLKVNEEHEEKKDDTEEHHEEKKDDTEEHNEEKKQEAEEHHEGVTMTMTTLPAEMDLKVNEDHEEKKEETEEHHKGVNVHDGGESNHEDDIHHEELSGAPSNITNLPVYVVPQTKVHTDIEGPSNITNLPVYVVPQTKVEEVRNAKASSFVIHNEDFAVVPPPGEYNAKDDDQKSPKPTRPPPPKSSSSPPKTPEVILRKPKDKQSSSTLPRDRATAPADSSRITTLPPPQNREHGSTMERKKKGLSLRRTFTNIKARFAGKKWVIVDRSSPQPAKNEIRPFKKSGVGRSKSMYTPKTTHETTVEDTTHKPELDVQVGKRNTTQVAETEKGADMAVHVSVHPHVQDAQATEHVVSPVKVHEVSTPPPEKPARPLSPPVRSQSARVTPSKDRTRPISTPTGHYSKVVKPPPLKLEAMEKRKTLATPPPRPPPVSPKIEMTKSVTLKSAPPAAEAATDLHHLSDQEDEEPSTFLSRLNQQHNEIVKTTTVTVTDEATNEGQPPSPCDLSPVIRSPGKGTETKYFTRDRSPASYVLRTVMEESFKEFLSIWRSQVVREQERIRGRMTNKPPTVKSSFEKVPGWDALSLFRDPVTGQRYIFKQNHHQDDVCLPKAIVADLLDSYILRETTTASLEYFPATRLTTLDEYLAKMDSEISKIVLVLSALLTFHEVASELPDDVTLDTELSSILIAISSWNQLIIFRKRPTNKSTTKSSMKETCLKNLLAELKPCLSGVTADLLNGVFTVHQAIQRSISRIFSLLHWETLPSTGSSVPSSVNLMPCLFSAINPPDLIGYMIARIYIVCVQGL